MNRSTDRAVADVLVTLPIAGFALGHPLIVPGVSIADVCLALFVSLAVLLLRPRVASLRQIPWLPSLGAFAAWTLLGAAWLLARGEPAFSPFEFGKSFAKLVLYASSSLLLAIVARLASPGHIARALGTWCAVAALIALALYAAILGGVPGARELACEDIGEDDCPAYFYELRWFGIASEHELEQGVHLRAMGLAPEPARLGLLLSLALGYLLLASPPRDARAWVIVAILFATALLTFSLTAVALLACVLGLATLRHRQRGLALLGAALAVTLLLAAVPPVRRSLGAAIANRIAAVFQGAPDVSVRLRLVTGWQLAYELAKLHPVTGVGLGHFDRRMPEVRDRVALAPIVGRRTQGWSVPGYLLATTGVVGLALFALTLHRALRRAPALGTVLVVAMLGDSTLLGATFWVFLALYQASTTVDEPNPAPASGGGTSLSSPILAPTTGISRLCSEAE